MIMVKKALVVEDNPRIWNEIAQEMGCVLKDYSSPSGYASVQNAKFLVYMTGEFGSAKEIIQNEKIDVYVLDNQIFSASAKNKILAQNELIEAILRTEQRAYFIYNISSHPTDDEMKKHISGNCSKSGKDIIKIIKMCFNGCE